MQKHESVSFKQYTWLLATYLKPQRTRVIALAVLLLSVTALQVALPQILRLFIDAVEAGAESQAIVQMALLFLGVALAQHGVSVGTTYFSENVAWTATNQLREDLTYHCLRLDRSFHETHLPGELIERIDGDISGLATFFSQFVIQILGSLLLLFAILAMVMSVSWQVGLILTGFYVLMLVMLIRSQSVTILPYKIASEVKADLFGFLEERLTATEDIRSSGADRYTLYHLCQRMEKRLRTQRRAIVTSYVPLVFANVMAMVGLALTLLLSSWLLSNQSATVGTVYMLYFYTALLTQPLRTLSDQFERFQTASASVLRIQELLNVRSAIADGPGAPLPPGPLPVSFEQVTFAYEEGDEVLSDITFQLEAGAVLGVLGRTGSGKSTLTRLLFRHYDPQRGRIALGGVDLRDAQLEDLRQRIAMVTQDVQVLHGSVRDNLTFYNAAIPDARILEALQLAGLGDWYNALPSGLDTMLGGGGLALSSGEAQLLAFARVFLKNAGLVILDEASSRLDSATERAVESSLNSLFHQRSGIIIAHRLSTLQRADYILILEQGRVREFGRREALLANPDSRYSQLLGTGMKEVML